jgi:hypothetical protein
MGVLSKDKEYFIKKFAFVFNLRSNLNSGDSREKNRGTYYLTELFYAVGAE